MNFWECRAVHRRCIENKDWSICIRAQKPSAEFRTPIMPGRRQKSNSSSSRTFKKENRLKREDIAELGFGGENQRVHKKESENVLTSHGGACEGGWCTREWPPRPYGSCLSRPWLLPGERELLLGQSWLWRKRVLLISRLPLQGARRLLRRRSQKTPSIWTVPNSIKWTLDINHPQVDEWLCHLGERIWEHGEHARAPNPNSVWECNNGGFQISPTVVLHASLNHWHFGRCCWTIDARLELHVRIQCFNSFPSMSFSLDLVQDCVQTCTPTTSLPLKSWCIAFLLKVRDEGCTRRLSESQ